MRELRILSNGQIARGIFEMFSLIGWVELISLSESGTGNRPMGLSGLPASSSN
jgi:hypothetical protein